MTVEMDERLWSEACLRIAGSCDDNDKKRGETQQILIPLSMLRIQDTTTLSLLGPRQKVFGMVQENSKAKGVAAASFHLVSR